MQAAQKTEHIRPVNAPKDAKLLEIRAKCVYEDEQLLEHLQEAMKRDMPHFFPSPQHDHEIVLVGSAPSIENHVEDIRRLKSEGAYIVAIKAAHDFLIGHDIVPHIALMVDPQPHIVQCFQKKRDDVYYFIASQCNPIVFDYFKGSQAILWHLLTGKTGEQEAINHEIALGGGSTSGMRAMTLAWAMGFRKMNLFGYDSSLPSKDSRRLKIDGTEIKEQEPFELWIDGEHFWSNPAMSAQATEFEKVMNSFKGQIQVRVWGKGAIPHLAACRIKRGLTDVVDGPFRTIGCSKDYFTV